jgi:hypothetical protein
MRCARVFSGGLLLAAAFMGAATAVGQNFAVRPWYRPYGAGYGYGGGWGGGGTAAGNYMQGMSTVIRSAGEYNLATAQAGVSYEEARSKYLDNRKKWSENYFEMKERRQAIEVQQREINKHSNEALNAAAKSSLPRTLGPNALDPVTGQITWPEILQGSEFADLRKQIDQQFELRAKTAQPRRFTRRRRKCRRFCGSRSRRSPQTNTSRPASFSTASTTRRGWVRFESS